MNQAEAFRTRTARMRRARTSSLLVAVVFAIIDRDGLAAVTIDRVGREAHLSRGSFYNYAPTLEDMLLRIAAAIGHVVELALTERFAGLDDPLQRLSKCQRFAVAWIGADPACVSILLRTLPFKGALSEPMRDRIIRDLAAAHRATAIDVPSPTLAADLSMGTVIAMLRHTLLNGPDLAAISAGSTMIFRALGVEPATARALADQPLPPLPPALRDRVIATGLVDPAAAIVQ